MERRHKAVSTWVGNPFIASPGEREHAQRLLRSLDLRAQLRRLTPAEGERLLLAAGHAEVWTSGAVGEVLHAWSGGLPRRRVDYFRVLMAAGRCGRALRQLRGSSSAMGTLRAQVWSACFGPSLVMGLQLERMIRDHDILLIGETGTGKEDVARAIQEGALGPEDGSRAPSANVNVAAIPETLIEAELFGHLKGSFTGATETRRGRIRSAHQGTFFLDEVGDLPEAMQVKLLRVLEADEVQPIGSDTVQQVDVRFVAASHKDLAERAAQGEFRQDLFQRLAGNVIRLAPLRDRREDIAEIADDFVRRCLGEGVDASWVGRAEAWLQTPAARSYPWPGNVRELQNALRSVLLGLEPKLQRAPSAGAAPGEAAMPAGIRDCTASEEEVTAWYLRRVLKQTGGNLAAAARSLGVDRSTVQRRARRLLPT